MDSTSDAQHLPGESAWAAIGVPLLGVGLALSGAVLIRSSGDPVAARSEADALVGLTAAALGCAVVLVWCPAAALALLAVLARRHGRPRLAEACGRCSPAALRRVAATVLGAQLLTAPAAASAAEEEISPFWDDAGGPAATATSAAAAPGPPPDAGADQGWDAPGAPPGPGPSSGELPAPGPAGTPGAGSRPGGAAAPSPCPSPAERTVDGMVTVIRGDTLWSLAASQLGPGATDEEIARAWPDWYELNRHVLVHGPHLLLPGQQLIVPTWTAG